jgi:hypothetical protein
LIEDSCAPFLPERLIVPPVAGEEMKYRGKQYTIVQEAAPDSWRWTVYLDEKTIQSGVSTSRAAATIRVIWLIDNALAPIKRKLPPSE